jgi:polysaccharide export outer membrane protein
MKIILIKCSLILILASSCTLSKRVVYFNDETKINNEPKTHVPVIQNDDLLSINVSSLDQVSTAPFNLPNSTVNTNTGYTLGSLPPVGYLVDGNGDINFPVIGKLHVQGKNRFEIITELENKLKEYVSHPVISIRILNFKVTVLGEVNRPGTITIPNEKVTILEAIGISGDLTILGERENIIVIREVNGEKKQFSVNINSNEIFNSPVYYLQQNDVIYVKPNRVKINSSVLNTSNAGIIISAISLFLTSFVIISKN